MDKPVTQRLEELRARAGLTVKQLAQKMGYRNASGVQRYLDPNLYKKSYFSIEIAQKLEKALAGRGAPPINRLEIYTLAGMEPPRDLPAPDITDPMSLAVEVVDKISAAAGRADPQLKAQAIREITQSLTRLKNSA